MHLEQTVLCTRPSRPRPPARISARHTAVSILKRRSRGGSCGGSVALRGRMECPCLRSRYLASEGVIIRCTSRTRPPKHGLQLRRQSIDRV
jgi:Rieske Fe-S protein